MSYLAYEQIFETGILPGRLLILGAGPASVTVVMQLAAEMTIADFLDSIIGRGLQSGWDR